MYFKLNSSSFGIVFQKAFTILQTNRADDHSRHMDGFPETMCQLSALIRISRIQLHKAWLRGFIIRACAQKASARVKRHLDTCGNTFLSRFVDRNRWRILLSGLRQRWLKEHSRKSWMSCRQTHLPFLNTLASFQIGTFPANEIARSEVNKLWPLQEKNIPKVLLSAASYSCGSNSQNTRSCITRIPAGMVN